MTMSSHFLILVPPPINSVMLYPVMNKFISYHKIRNLIDLFHYFIKKPVVLVSTNPSAALLSEKTSPLHPQKFDRQEAIHHNPYKIAQYKYD